MLRSFSAHPEARWPNLKTVFLGDDQEDKCTKAWFGNLMIDYSRENITSTPRFSLFRKFLKIKNNSWRYWTMTHSRKGCMASCRGLLCHYFESTWSHPKCCGNHFLLATGVIFCRTWPVSKMAENTETAVKMARCLAVVHIIVGFLLACFGIPKTNLPTWEFFSAWISAAICFGFWVSYENDQKL